MRELIELKLEYTGLDPAYFSNLPDDELFELFIQRFSLREPVIVADEEMRRENARMKEELKRLYGVERPFICGDIGELDEHGMRDFYLVAPSYGADGAAIYKKHRPYSIPEQ